MTHSTNWTPSDEEAIVLVRRSEATGKWRPFLCVEFEGAPSLYLTPEDWVDCGLKMGMRMSPGQYAEIASRARVSQAFREALRLLEVRPRFEGELRRALARKGWEPEIVDGALARLRDKGLVDDETLVRDRVEAWTGARSRREMRAKLRARGAPAALVEQSLAACVDDEREKEAALRVAEKYLRRTAGRQTDVPQADAVERRALAHLVRKGFSPGVARQAVRRAVERLAADSGGEWA
ncbi:regulatory protein RecX [Alicyclobacillus fructus]|nr:regulatory protein RecX [Alicyclobacillus fructus]